MEKLKLKYDQLNLSLNRLNEAIVGLKKVEFKFCDYDPEGTIRTYRDSLIQRFELSLDLFWKYVKLNLEEMKLNIEPSSPKNIIREACRIKLISEQDAEEILVMIDDRNMSSHIYQEEIAEDIAARIPEHYKIIEKYTEKLSPGKNW